MTCFCQYLVSFGWVGGLSCVTDKNKTLLSNDKNVLFASAIFVYRFGGLGAHLFYLLSEGRQ